MDYRPEGRKEAKRKALHKMPSESLTPSAR